MKANLPKEALGALLFCLQQIAPQIASNDLKEPILAMIQNSQPLLAQMAPGSKNGGQKTGSQPGNSAAPGTGVPVGPVRPTPRVPPPPTSMFPPPNLQHPGLNDPLSGLSGQFSDRLNLGTAPVVSSANSSSAFSAPGGNLPGNFRNTAPSPGSPSRMFGAPGAPVPHTPDGGSSPSLLNFANHPVTSASTGSNNQSGSSSGTIEQMRAGLANMSNLFPEINGPISKVSLEF